jgi:hypothetical protein
MTRGGLIARASAIVWVGFALNAVASGVASAQGGSDCDLKVKPAPGHIGYKKRPYGCEGMYVGLQSAPLGVQVVSLLRGTLAFDDTRSVMFVSVAADTAALKAPVRVVGRTRRANLHWAFDGQVEPGASLKWDLREVVRPAELVSETIGMYGMSSRRPDGSGGPIFVPLLVSGSPSTSVDRSAPLEVIVRVPAAGSLCWSLTSDGSAGETSPPCEWISPMGGNPDGYFLITIPPEKPGNRLALRWRVRGAGPASLTGSPVYLTIQR